eukprot:8210374-Pyramimonas_sp.AAC.3
MHPLGSASLKGFPKGLSRKVVPVDVKVELTFAEGGGHRLTLTVRDCATGAVAVQQLLPHYHSVETGWVQVLGAPQTGVSHYPGGAPWGYPEVLLREEHRPLGRAEADRLNAWGKELLVTGHTLASLYHFTAAVRAHTDTSKKHAVHLTNCAAALLQVRTSSRGPEPPIRLIQRSTLLQKLNF